MLSRRIHDYIIHNRLVCNEELYSDTEYDVGDFEQRSLFFGNRKIQDSKQLMVVAVRFLYLNPNIEYEEFYDFLEYLTRYENGAVVNSFNLDKLESSAIYWYGMFLENQLEPRWLRRKIIFGKEVSRRRKCQIIGMEFKKGKKYDDDAIVEAFNVLKYKGDRIVTLKVIAEYLECSPITLSRNVSEATKEMIAEHNKLAREDRDLNTLISTAQELIDRIGIDNLNITVRFLREVSSVRNKEVTGRAISYIKRYYDKEIKSNVNDVIR